MRRIGNTTPDDVRIMEKFRNVFDTPDGHFVLACILRDLGVDESDPTGGEAGYALRCYGMKLLERIGLNHEFNLVAKVQKLFEIPPYEWDDVKILSEERSI